MKSLSTTAKPSLTPISQFLSNDRDAFLEEIKNELSIYECTTKEGDIKTFRTSLNHEVEDFINRLYLIKFFQKNRPIATLISARGFAGNEKLIVQYANDIPSTITDSIATNFNFTNSGNFKIGIELKVFEDAFFELASEDQSILINFLLINRCYSNLQAQTYVTALNTFQKLVATKMGSVSIRKKLSNRASNRRRSKVRCIQLVELLLKNHSRILVVRVDLGLIRDPAKLQQHAVSPNFAQAEHDSQFIQESLCRFYAASKHNQLKHALGYIMRIEYTPVKGYHCHNYYFFNANDHREDITWGQYIAEKWKVATNNLGTAFICNMKKNEYRYRALGILEYTDNEMLENLKATFDYICKNDQYFAFTNGKQIRSFRTSQIPKVSDTKLGRPRKFDQLSHLDSDQTDDAQVGGL